MASKERLITLDEFIIEAQSMIEDATGELSGLLRDIGLAAKIVNRDLKKAGLVDKNKAVLKTCLNLITKIAKALGPGAKQYTKEVMTPVL